MRRTIAILPLLAAFAVTGCGSQTATISGKVTFQGRPVTSGSIIVLSADETARTGVILADGTYSVDGVNPGPVRFGVLSPEPGSSRSIVTKKKKAPRAQPGSNPAEATGWSRLPTTFGDPGKSGLECDVAASRVQHNLELQ